MKIKFLLGFSLLFLSSQIGQCQIAGLNTVEPILNNVSNLIPTIPPLSTIPPLPTVDALLVALSKCVDLTGPTDCHPNEPDDLVFNSNPLAPVTEKWKINMTARQKVEYEGYGAKDHFVQTKDGYEIYLLQVIPQGEQSKNRTPCLLVHGTFQSANDWVVQPNKTSLAMQLVNNSYDVWIMSLRGTTNSTNFRPPVTQANYWNFSMDNQIAYDLPAVIDYILDYTKQLKLFYFGYSLGGTLGLGLLASKPEYNSKICAFFGIHAPAYHGNTTSKILRALSCLAKAFPQIRYYEQPAIPTQLSPIIWKALTGMTLTFCQPNYENYDSYACSQFLNAIFGKNNHPANETNAEMLPVVTPYFPNSESMQTLVQTSWDIVDPFFSYFDYGERGNLAAYNQTIPPRYNVSKITTNVIQYCSKCDAGVDIFDCNKLAANLPTPPTYFKIQNFNHIDAFYGNHIVKFYAHILSQVKQVLASLG